MYRRHAEADIPYHHTKTDIRDGLSGVGALIKLVSDFIKNKLVY